MIDYSYFGNNAFTTNVIRNALSDMFNRGYHDKSPTATAAEMDAINHAMMATSGCIDPPETPEPQNPMLQAWIRHCRLPLGSTRPGSKLGLPFDPTIPIGQGKSSALLTVAKIDHRMGLGG